MNFRYKILFSISILLFSVLLLGCNNKIKPNNTTKSLKTSGQEVKEKEPVEILYHVCQRSFYDSNGDLHGDLKGLEQKLDYLQDLGITSILLLPLYESDYYHNYFPTNFKKIDPEFGTEADFLDLVKAIHQREMKIYMDMEIHYVTEDHLWFKDSYQNPASNYSEYIIYNDEKNEDYESIIFGLKRLPSYNGLNKRVTTLNLYNEKCKRYIYDLFHYWLDPNQDGNFEDGVDGFRIDHMMDDLDWKNGVLPNMFSQFWYPLFQELRAVNHQVKIIGEQANWDDFGENYFTQADIDYMFAFNIKKGIVAFNKQQIIASTDTTWQITPTGKNQIIFIENHDTHRFASEVEKNLSKSKVGAAFNLLLKGIPGLYYGQELGMQGKFGLKKHGPHDGNGIPVREAFEWSEKWNTPGMALWYKDTGSWWTDTHLKDSDGISYEEQKMNETSLWNFYKQLITLRKTNPALAHGTIDFLENHNENVVTFLRKKHGQSILVHINLSENTEKVEVPENILKSKKSTILFGAQTKLNTLQPLEVRVVELE